MQDDSQLALVTGAAGVMGRAVVDSLVREGYFVVIVDLNERGLDGLAGRYPDSTYAVVADVSDYNDVQQAVSRVRSEIGTVSVLVNNAGIFSATKSSELTPDEWHHVLNVNLDSALYFSQAVIPDMRSNGWGRIVNTSSLSAKSGGITSGTAYAVSKGAMITLTYSLAAETVRDGITVNAIAPAWVRTPMVTNLSDSEQKATLEKIPVGRFCEPEEFAHVVSFLVSPNAGFITGEVVDLNGGFHFD